MGLVFQPQLGLRRASAFWTITLPAMLAAMNRFERVRALMNGSSLAGVAVHFVLWPVDWRRVPPRLIDAEGMGPNAVSWYNLLLYAWLGVTTVALITETRRRPWALPGLLAVLPLRASASHHFSLVGRRGAEPTNMVEPCDPTKATNQELLDETPLRMGSPYCR